MTDKKGKNDIYDCLVIGAGPVALAVARGLQVRELAFSLCGTLPRDCRNSPDLRTAALFDGSIRLLERLGVWPALEPVAAPLAGIRLIDATSRLLRAPEQLFASADLGLDQLGFNIPNPALVDALRGSLGANDNVTRTVTSEVNLTAKVRRIAIAPDHVTATLADGTERRARMAIAADGRRSITRMAAGIEVKAWDHDQAAITAHFDHTLPNQWISSEIHTRAGPCTAVPLALHKSSLVWIERPDKATALAASDDAAFLAALDKRLDGLLGPVRSVSARRVFPLSSMIAERFAGNRVALVGESGHAFPPIGAQGLNLGLRDVAALIDHLSGARRDGVDVGSDSILAAYCAERRGDVLARTYGVDAFNVSLASSPAGLLRGAALHAAKASPEFRRFVIKRGMQPLGAWPSLMR